MATFLLASVMLYRDDALPGYSFEGEGQPVFADPDAPTGYVEWFYPTQLGVGPLPPTPPRFVWATQRSPFMAAFDSENSDPIVVVASAPVITVVSPPLGTGVAKNTPLVIDVTDAGTLERAVLVLSQGDLTRAELVHDGVRFTAPYSQGSTAAVISGGLRFTLVRAGGWTGNPTVELVAYNVAGKEA